MEKGMATHSSILAWKIPWTEEPGGLQSMGSQRVRHGCVTTTTVSYGILVPWPGVELVPSTVEVQSLNHWTAREVPISRILNSIISFWLTCNTAVLWFQTFSSSMMSFPLHWLNLSDFFPVQHKPNCWSCKPPSIFYRAYPFILVPSKTFVWQIVIGIPLPAFLLQWHGWALLETSK